MPCPLSPCCDRVVSGHRMGGGKGLCKLCNYVLIKFESGSRQNVCDNHVWARAMSCGDSSEFPTLYTIVRWPYVVIRGCKHMSPLFGGIPRWRAGRPAVYVVKIVWPGCSSAGCFYVYSLLLSLMCALAVWQSWIWEVVMYEWVGQMYPMYWSKCILCND